MMNKSNAIDIDAYISELLLDSEESPGVIDNLPGSIQENIKLLPDDYINTTRNNYENALSSTNEYFSFDIGSSGYLIAVNNVITVRASLGDKPPNGHPYYDVSALVDEYHEKQPRMRQYELLLKTKHELAIGIDRINDVVSLKPDDILYKQKDNHRSWLAGVTRDFQYVLLNTDILVLSIQENEGVLRVGIKSASKVGI